MQTDVEVSDGCKKRKIITTLKNPLLTTRNLHCVLIVLRTAVPNSKRKCTVHFYFCFGHFFFFFFQFKHTLATTQTGYKFDLINSERFFILNPTRVSLRLTLLEFLTFFSFLLKIKCFLGGS